jgi:hypothetical protein
LKLKFIAIFVVTCTMDGRKPTVNTEAYFSGLQPVESHLFAYINIFAKILYSVI